MCLLLLVRLLLLLLVVVLAAASSAGDAGAPPPAHTHTPPLTFLPVDTVPAKTRPKATKRPLSLVGIILEMYIIRGPSGSQFLVGFLYKGGEGKGENRGRGEGGGGCG